MTAAHDHDHDHDHETAATMRDFGRDAWEERYRTRHAVWSGHPNAQLVDETTTLQPGRALDVGCGEGADAVWLANLGWLVTAVDLSVTALERGRAQAESSGVEAHVEFTDADLEDVIASHEPWNLVTSQYTHPEQGGRWLVETLAPAVAPGGMLLVVGHHPTDPHAAAHPDLRDAAFAAEDVAEALPRDQWEVSATMRERTTLRDGGPARLWRDSVLIARRHG